MSIAAIGVLVLLVTAGLFALLGFLYASRQTINLEEFMVSRNQFGGGMAFATVVASAMGVWILFSPPQVGAGSGLTGIIGYCIGSALPLSLFTVLGPRLRRILPNGHSLNEFVLLRFGNAMYLLALLVIVFYMFIYLSAELTAIAKAVQILANVPLGWTALVVITATFLYTTYGGLRSTIFTDAIQFTVMVPLLLISFWISLTALGGWQAALEPIRLEAPELLSWSNLSGIKFGATLIIAILGAEIFNQSSWQRVYAGRTTRTVQRSFLWGAIALLPVLAIAGSLGLLARHFGFSDDRAFFSMIQELSLPSGFIVLVLVLALALVMSTLSSLLNGIASVFTGDLIRLFPALQVRGLLRASRVLTIAFGIPAILIAARGFDVLYLFLLADLVCAGAFVPVIVGLYSTRLTQRVALTASLVGIVGGALFFPAPDFSAWLPLPGNGDLLVSFAIAALLSSLLVWLGIIFFPAAHAFDFKTLQDKVKNYDRSTLQEPAQVAD
ncbi:sodium:solute symporter family transporter [Vacuolonema iberomarrocanum]|uniref:sodium:solute symporter family transporter n=1 Tax=Vacuolonema iberomarrocanum TaxID=3454632 RepID=UPI0019F86A34|nr:Na+/proline symporter [filamentous cyanobacterium LEGE 07170]